MGYLLRTPAIVYWVIIALLGTHCAIFRPKTVHHQLEDALIEERIRQFQAKYASKQLNVSMALRCWFILQENHGLLMEKPIPENFPNIRPEWRNLKKTLHLPADLIARVDTSGWNCGLANPDSVYLFFTPLLPIQDSPDVLLITLEISSGISLSDNAQLIVINTITERFAIKNRKPVLITKEEDLAASIRLLDE